MLAVPPVALGVVIVLNAGRIEAQTPGFDDGVIDKEPRPVKNDLPATDRTVPHGKPPPDSVPTPPPHVPAKREPMTLEEQEQLRQKVEQEGRWIPIKVSGPETKGSTIYVGNKKVQLPADAYIEHYISFGSCIPCYPCPQFPLYIIRRGDSRSEISLRSRSIIAESIAPGEEGTFDFLRKSLPFRSPVSGYSQIKPGL